MDFKECCDLVPTGMLGDANLFPPTLDGAKPVNAKHVYGGSKLASVEGQSFRENRVLDLATLRQIARHPEACRISQHAIGKLHMIVVVITAYYADDSRDDTGSALGNVSP